jgi:uncharacterized protein
MKKFFFRTLTFFILGIFLIAAPCENQPDIPDPKLGPVVVIKNSKGEEWKIKVELKTTTAEQAKGMMYRWSIEKDHGMLFLYKDSKIRSFWMKNCRFPLDIIFIGSDKKIAGIVHEAEPYTDTSRKIDKPSQHVLEVEGGECKAHGVMAGGQVYFFGIEGW